METARRWNELDYYKEGQTIYGRDKEIYSVSNGIAKNLQTIIYGQSGVGKSSLLFAGIFPELRKKRFFPVFIRFLDVEPDNYAKFVKDSVLNEACTAHEHLGKPALNCNRRDYSVQEDEDFWMFFHNTEFLDNEGNIYIPVLVFDQFEEILNNNNTYNAAKDFMLELYALLDDSRIVPDNMITYSNFRIVLSIREDYLYCLEELIDKYNLSELRYNRYRIKWLSERNARTVILNTFGSSLAPESAGRICSDIIAKATNDSGDISTIYLSLICSILDMQSNGGVIEGAVLGHMDKYIYNYYSQKMNIVPFRVKKYLEQHLVTTDGRRNSLDYNGILRSGVVTAEELDLLISNRILRRVSLTGNTRIEYVHDIIPKVIFRKENYSILKSLAKTFKERNNIAGTATKEEFLTSNSCICSVMILLVVGVCEFLLGRIPLSLLVFCIGLILVCSLRLLLSLYIRRAHDIGMSGWEIYSSKLFNEDSSVFPYSPKTSYYYSHPISVIKSAKGQTTGSDRMRELAITKYEYVAKMLKQTNKLVGALLIIVLMVLIAKNYPGKNVYAFCALLSIVMTTIVYVLSIDIFTACARRLNYLNINPLLMIVPFYNIYLFFVCFRNDSSDTPQLYTASELRNQFVTIAGAIYLLLSALPVLYLIALYYMKYLQS